MTVRIEHGDCMDVLPALLAEGVRFDSVVCDPPYHLTSGNVVMDFTDGRPNGRRKTNKAGFMGKEWDGGDIAFRPETWAAVLAVMKPGAHLIAFSGTRTYHRMACAIEDAGFEIRDQLGWLYGSGFPKSHDVSKGIDKAAGAEREVVGRARGVGKQNPAWNGTDAGRSKNSLAPEYDSTAPSTDAARQWQGWGTALKPAWEPIVLARAPFRGTVAANVQAHGTGALNIDGCRIATDERLSGSGVPPLRFSGSNSRPFHDAHVATPSVAHDLGRWPANVIHDGSEEVLAAFPETGAAGKPTDDRGTGGIWSGSSGKPCGPQHGDSGSAARFFYSAKADAGDRLGSKHPTVKPVDLMAYLCRLVTPPGGLILDLFAGSGTTGMACLREGFDAVLIEREAEYVADIRRRIAHVQGLDTALFGAAA